MSKFNAIVKDENKNQILCRFDPPMTVEIDGGVTMDLVYHGWPSICKGDGDTVYAVSSARIEHVDPFGAIGFSKSLDGGKTWSEYKLIIDTPLDDRDCGVTYLGNGHLVVNWFTHDAYKYREGGCYSGWRKNVTPEQVAAVDAKFDKLTPEEGVGGCFVIHSLDDGKTWGEPIRLGITTPHGATVMQDGKSLIIVGVPWYSKLAMGVDLAGEQLHVFKSTDGGYKWEYVSQIFIPEDLPGVPCEAHIIQLKDGSFLAALRCEKRGVGMTTYVMRSEDCLNWTLPEKVESALGSPPHLLQLKNGNILLTYSTRIAKGCGERACISTDGGKTWSNEMIISLADQVDGWDLGYPSSVELDDGTIISAFYQKYEMDKKCSFLYTKWEIEEA